MWAPAPAMAERQSEACPGPDSGSGNDQNALSSRNPPYAATASLGATGYFR